jgi:Aldehyde dehydrogenase family/Pyridine nucleotide-disulphide oxidoreductase
MPDRQVVILGAGFGGLYAALHLERALRRERSARIVLLDKGNYHLFVPMLHEITSGGVEPRHVVRPLRPLFRNTRVDFRRAEVRSIDLEGRRILTDRGEVGYDYLVIALGSTTNFFGVDGASETAFTLRSLKDAVGLRNHLLEMFERADLERDLDRRRRLLTFCLVGAGCTGVELATELQDLGEDQFRRDGSEKVATAVAATGYANYCNAGRVCISTQRVLASGCVYADFLDALTPKVAVLKVGNQLDESVKVGPMVKEKEAIRVEEWIKEAVSTGARLVTGGTRHGAMYAPTIVADVKPEMKISYDELFGPAVVVTPFTEIEDAIALANDTRYGLAAGIFTENLEWAWKFAREVQSGNLHINWGPQWRADLMPYGGLKESGFGKEGPAYAIEEMTELKMVVFHLSS